MASAELEVEDGARALACFPILALAPVEELQRMARAVLQSAALGGAPTRAVETVGPGRPGPADGRPLPEG